MIFNGRRFDFGVELSCVTYFCGLMESEVQGCPVGNVLWTDVDDGMGCIMFNIFTYYLSRSWILCLPRVRVCEG
jgi:hypothetical protein